MVLYKVKGVGGNIVFGFLIIQLCSSMLVLCFVPMLLSLTLLHVSMSHIALIFHISVRYVNFFMHRAIPHGGDCLLIFMYS